MKLIIDIPKDLYESACKSTYTSLDELDAIYAIKEGKRLITCEGCIHYDPEHVEKDGVRYEYSDMPKDAFDPTELFVTIDYGINVGGRCCRDYNRGYVEDKRVYRCKDDYCSRAEPKCSGRREG